MLLSGKFTSDYKYYLDPDYQNNSGRLVNEFKQKEYYASAAFSYPLLKHLTAGISTDYLYNSLKRSDTFAIGFANPGRHSIYSNVALQYKNQRFELFGHLLYSNFSEQVENGKPAAPQQQWVPAFAVSFQPVATWPVRLRASFKKTFRMPSFDDLYYTNIGNSSLRPEYATLLNAGVSTRFKSSKLLREINISADAYFNQVKDKILAVPRQDLFQWSMLNIGKSEATGIDIACSATFNPIQKLQLNVHSTYSYQRSLDITNPNEALYKTQLPYTPEHSGTAGISALYHHWSLHYNIVSSGYRYRAGEQLAANLVQGWATHDISIATDIVSSSKFGYKAIFEINNLLNTQYEIIKYYPMQRLNYRISLAVTFKKEKTTK